MKQIAIIASVVGLAATILPSCLGFFGVIELDLVKWLTLLGTIVWFIATPLWVGRELPLDSDEVEI